MEEGSDLSEDRKKDSYEENKHVEDEKRIEKGDTKELTPIQVTALKMTNVEASELISRKISLMSESDCSEWIDVRK